jgi:hypothetical protein
MLQVELILGEIHYASCVTTLTHLVLRATCATSGTTRLAAIGQTGRARVGRA